MIGILFFIGAAFFAGWAICYAVHSKEICSSSEERKDGVNAPKGQSEEKSDIKSHHSTRNSSEGKEKGVKP